MTNITTTAINVNVPTDVKEEATTLFNSLGLNMSTAINIFLKRAISERGIPFEVKQQPSKEFTEALKELDYMEKHPEEYQSFYSVEELMEDLNSND